MSAYPRCFNRLRSLPIIKLAREKYDEAIKDEILELLTKDQMEIIGDKAVLEARVDHLNNILGEKKANKEKISSEEESDCTEKKQSNGVSIPDDKGKLFNRLYEAKGKEIYDYAITHKIPKTADHFGITPYMVRRIIQQTCK